MGRGIQSAQLSWINTLTGGSPRISVRLNLKPSSTGRVQPFANLSVSRGTAYRLKRNARRMEGAENSRNRQRMPLAEVVADCVKRWFQDTLKEANNGDAAMQVLVGQMYYSGYGIAKDVHKGRLWVSRASKSRSSVWKVGDKHPGYNASDSDSDDQKEEGKQ